MPQVHSSAVIDAQAELAADVVVGPGCVIEGPVRIGPGTRLIGHVYLLAPLTIGRDNTIYPFACIGFEPQDRKFERGKSPSAGVVIGDKNLIRESVTIHRATSVEHPTRVGDDNMLMTNAHLGHDVTVGSGCTLASGALIAGHCDLHDAVTVAGNSAIHQFCRLGCMSFIGGVSAVSKDVPPFALVSGLNNVMGVNVVGLRRSGVGRAAIDAVNAAWRTIYLEGHTLPVAREALAAQARQCRAAGDTQAADLLDELCVFLAGSQRGIVPHAMMNQRHGMQR